MKQIPIPIQRTLLKTILVSCAIMAFGLIWGLVSRDHIFLGLTGTVGIGERITTCRIFSMTPWDMWKIPGTIASMNRSFVTSISRRQYPDGSLFL